MVDVTLELPSLVVPTLQLPSSLTLRLCVCNTLHTLAGMYAVTAKTGMPSLVALLLLYADIPANSGLCRFVRFPLHQAALGSADAEIGTTGGLVYLCQAQAPRSA